MNAIAASEVFQTKKIGKIALNRKNKQLQKCI